VAPAPHFPENLLWSPAKFMDPRSGHAYFFVPMCSSEKSDDEVLALALRLAADARNMQRYCEKLRQMTITVPSRNDAFNDDDIKVNRNDRRIRIRQGHDIVVLSVNQGRALAHAILTVARAMPK